MEESPNRLKIAREIIPTPSQNRKQSLSPTKGQGGSAAREEVGFRKGDLRQPLHPHTAALPPRPPSIALPPLESSRASCGQRGRPTRVWGPWKGAPPRPRPSPKSCTKGLLTRDLGGPEPLALKIALASSQAIFRSLRSGVSRKAAAGHTPPGSPGALAQAPPLATAGTKAGQRPTVWSELAAAPNLLGGARTPAGPL